MQLKELRKKLLTRMGVDPEGSTPTSAPDSIRIKQVSILAMIAAGVIVSGVYLLSSKADENNETETTNNEKPTEKVVSEMGTPLTPVGVQEIWSSRMEKKAKLAQEESAQLREENKFLGNRLDVVESLIKLQGHNLRGVAQNKDEPGQNGLIPVDGTNNNQQEPESTSPPFNSPTPRSSSQPNRYPLPGSDMYAQSGDVDRDFASGHSQPKRKQGPKIARLNGGKFSGVSYKNASMYLPAGSYSKAVLTSGVAASTSTVSQGNPQPVVLRLVDNGNLPRGFKSRIKDAVLTGGCYGDISSERVICRLETMAWVEGDGTTVEKKVEGWVIGEDGRAGLRGQVVDRSGEVVRESFGAGILSAISNFIKFEATSSVYPVSPYGVTNALSGKDVLQGAAASGAGNAFDKLAEFSIRRAEQMQPVIMIASGRVVDVVFKSGVDLSPEASGEMKVIGSANQNNSEVED